MKHDYKLVRDSKGSIRIDENLKFTTAQATALLETIYLQTGADIGLEELNMTLREYDGPTKKINRGASKHWTDEEREYVLIHHGEGDEAVAKAIGRSGMSIYMAKAHLLSDFDAWVQEHPDVAGLTRAERIKQFVYGKEGVGE